MSNQLKTNWLVEGSIDFEYKKYLLLAYLQQVSRNFDAQKVYPFLSDLIFHYQNLVIFKEEKQKVSGQFTQRIRKIDLDNFRIEYEKLMHDDEYMEEIETILTFAIPQIKVQMQNGRELYEFVEAKLQIEPVGIVPLQSDEGYLLLSNGKRGDTQVYNYKLTIFESASEKYRAIRTHYLRSYIRKFTNTYETIKLDLIRTNRALPNPATFLVRSEQAFPLQETLLPIAKRSLVRFISRF
ncbi:MAG: hypothetical protein ACPG49_03490 [Chitinophagales bacterium]